MYFLFKGQPFWNSATFSISQIHFVRYSCTCILNTCSIMLANFCCTFWLSLQYNTITSVSSLESPLQFWILHSYNVNIKIVRKDVHNILYMDLASFRIHQHKLIWLHIHFWDWVNPDQFIDEYCNNRGNGRLLCYIVVIAWLYVECRQLVNCRHCSRSGNGQNWTSFSMFGNK